MQRRSPLSGDSVELPKLRKRKRKEQAAAGDRRAAAGSAGISRAAVGSAGSSRALGGGASESGAAGEPEPVRYRLAYIPARVGQSAVRPCQQRPGVVEPAVGVGGLSWSEAQEFVEQIARKGFQLILPPEVDDYSSVLAAAGAAECGCASCEAAKRAAEHQPSIAQELLEEAEIAEDTL